MIALMVNVVEHLQKLVPVITITATNHRSQIVIYKKKHYIYSFFMHSSIIYSTGQKF